MKNRKMTHQHKCIVKAYNETNGNLKIKQAPRSTQKGSKDLPLFREEQPTLFCTPDDETGLYDINTEMLEAAARDMGCKPEDLRTLTIHDLWDITDNVSNGDFFPVFQ